MDENKNWLNEEDVEDIAVQGDEEEVFELEAQQEEDALQPSPEKLPPAKPRKKRNIKKMIFAAVGIVLALLVVVNIVSGMLAGPAPVYVQAQEVVRGQVNQTLITSGLLSTGQRVTVYCPVGAPVSQMNVELGSSVSKDSVMFEFDTTMLERNFRAAKANLNLAYSQSKQAKDTSLESQQNANDYQASIDSTKNQRDIAASRVKSLSDQLAQAQQELEALKAAGAPANEIAAKEAEIKELTVALEAAQADLAGQEQLIKTLETYRDAEQAKVLSEEQQNQMYYQQVPSQTAYETAKEDLEAGKAGVTAPISGVVTSLAADEGAMMMQYSPMCTIESLEKVNVIVALSRYDLERVRVGQSAVVTTAGKEYAATVTKIDGMATASGTSSFVNCTVSINAPDSDIRLGLEANVEIGTGQVNDVIAVPVMAVNSDVTGTYCYIIDEESKAHRVEVEMGLSSDTMVEITSGLTEGQQVVVGAWDITEGTLVTTNPSYQATGGLVQVGMG